MQVQTRHRPGFAVARCMLAPNEQVQVEAGAMYATSRGVQLEAKIQGGFLKGLKRAALAGESLFTTTYTAPQQGGWVDIAHHLAGDVTSLEISPGMPFHITKGGWLASSGDIQLQSNWGGMKNAIGGEGAFVLRAEGKGTIVMGCYGAFDFVELGPGQGITVDTGHVVGYDAFVNYNIRRAVEGKSIQSMKSGEGFVFDFNGPGRVFLQSRNPAALIEWLTAQLPFARKQ